MDLTIRYLLSIPFARRAINEKKAAVVTPCSTTKRVNPGTFSCTATASITTDKTPFERETQKHNLLRAIQDTQRGLVATSDQRSSIEEALVCVEGYEAGSPIDLVKLDGTWRLQYTSAPDVLVLLVSAARLPFFQVGQIYQKFECRDNSDCGIVRNVVRWSIPSLLEEQEGATLLVSAKFSVVSKRNINLQFEEPLLVTTEGHIPWIHPTWAAADLLLNNWAAAEYCVFKLDFSPASNKVHYTSILGGLRLLLFSSELGSVKVAIQNINISEELQAVIAPAILPRTFLSLQILQFIRGFRAQFPLRSSERKLVGGLYYLTYLDGNMLLGRAVGGGGVFVFTKAQPLT